MNQRAKSKDKSSPENKPGENKSPAPSDDAPRRDDDDLSALLRSSNPEQKPKT